MHESFLLRLDPDEKLKPDEQNSISFNSTLTSPKMIVKIPTKSYVDSLHEINRNRRSSSSVYNDQDIGFDNIKLTILDSVSVNRNPSSDSELTNKKYVVDSLGGLNILGFSQTLQKYLRVNVGNDVYNLTRNEKLQITDTTIFKYSITDGYLPQN